RSILTLEEQNALQGKIDDCLKRLGRERDITLYDETLDALNEVLNDLHNADIVTKRGVKHWFARRVLRSSGRLRSDLDDIWSDYKAKTTTPDDDDSDEEQTPSSAGADAGPETVGTVAFASTHASRRYTQRNPTYTQSTSALNHNFYQGGSTGAHANLSSRGHFPANPLQSSLSPQNLHDYSTSMSALPQPRHQSSMNPIIPGGGGPYARGPVRPHFAPASYSTLSSQNSQASFQDPNYAPSSGGGSSNYAPSQHSQTSLYSGNGGSGDSSYEGGNSDRSGGHHRTTTRHRNQPSMGAFGMHSMQPLPVQSVPNQNADGMPLAWGPAPQYSPDQRSQHSQDQRSQYWQDGSSSQGRYQ
ncbi:hypothetical protein C8R43DRAFT_978073, partial [Mycena crocata]